MVQAKAIIGNVLLSSGTAWSGHSTGIQYSGIGPCTSCSGVGQVYASGANTTFLKKVLEGAQASPLEGINCEVIYQLACYLLQVGPCFAQFEAHTLHYI